MYKHTFWKALGKSHKKWVLVAKSQNIIKCYWTSNNYKVITECEEVTSKWLKANKCIKLFSGLPQTSVHWKKSISSENIWRFFSLRKSLKAEASASSSRVAVCISNCVSVISLLIFTAISKYSQSHPHLAGINPIISELCVKEERLLHFLNKHTPPPNSTYKYFNNCTLQSTASQSTSGQRNKLPSKRMASPSLSQHVPSPCFGWVLVTLSRVTSDLLPVSLLWTNAQFLTPSAVGTGSGQTWDTLIWGSSISWH